MKYFRAVLGEYSIDQSIDLVIADKAALRSFIYDTTLVLLILKEAYNNLILYQKSYAFSCYLR